MAKRSTGSGSRSHLVVVPRAVGKLSDLGGTTGIKVRIGDLTGTRNDCRNKPDDPKEEINLLRSKVLWIARIDLSGIKFVPFLYKPDQLLICIG